jgi:lipopolysaccharide export system permease protein
VAERARHAVTPDGSKHTITLFDGERFEGVPGSPQWRIVRFGEHIIPVQVPALSGVVNNLEAQPTSALLHSNDPEKRAELHWRLSLPLMCIVLTLLAVPLSRLRPRQGRYARVWLAAVIYFVYSNLIAAGKVWIARGTVPEWLGLWWTHAVVVLLAVAVIIGPPGIANLRNRIRS